MKKMLLFLFMCLGSFFIYENCSALEPSEVTETNIYEYFKEKYPDYFNDYYFIFNGSNNYVLMSFDKPIIFSYTKSNGEIRIQPKLSQTFVVSQLWLKKTDLSVNRENLLFNHPANTNNSTFFVGMANYSDLETTRNKFLYLNFDIYGDGSTLLFPEIVEIEPEPTPEPSAPPEEEGGVSANDVINIYMKYLLMCFPVGLIMVTIEKFTEIFHNFILGKMRRG